MAAELSKGTGLPPVPSEEDAPSKQLGTSFLAACSPESGADTLRKLARKATSPLAVIMAMSGVFEPSLALNLLASPKPPGVPSSPAGSSVSDSLSLHVGPSQNLYLPRIGRYEAFERWCRASVHDNYANDGVRHMGKFFEAMNVNQIEQRNAAELELNKARSALFDRPEYQHAKALFMWAQTKQSDPMVPFERASEIDPSYLDVRLDRAKLSVDLMLKTGYQPMLADVQDNIVKLIAGLQDTSWISDDQQESLRQHALGQAYYFSALTDYFSVWTEVDLAKRAEVSAHALNSLALIADGSTLKDPRVIALKASLLYFTDDFEQSERTFLRAISLMQEAGEKLALEFYNIPAKARVVPGFMAAVANGTGAQFIKDFYEQEDPSGAEINDVRLQNWLNTTFILFNYAGIIGLPKGITPEERAKAYTKCHELVLTIQRLGFPLAIHTQSADGPNGLHADFSDDYFKAQPDGSRNVRDYTFLGPKGFVHLFFYDDKRLGTQAGDRKVILQITDNPDIPAVVNLASLSLGDEKKSVTVTSDGPVYLSSWHPSFDSNRLLIACEVPPEKRLTVPQGEAADGRYYKELDSPLEVDLNVRHVAGLSANQARYRVKWGNVVDLASGNQVVMVFVDQPMPSGRYFVNATITDARRVRFEGDLPEFAVSKTIEVDNPQVDPTKTGIAFGDIILEVPDSARPNSSFSASGKLNEAQYTPALKSAVICAWSPEGVVALDYVPLYRGAFRDGERLMLRVNVRVDNQDKPTDNPTKHERFCYVDFVLAPKAAIDAWLQEKKAPVALENFSAFRRWTGLGDFNPNEADKTTRSPRYEGMQAFPNGQKSFLKDKQPFRATIRPILGTPSGTYILFCRAVDLNGEPLAFTQTWLRVEPRVEQIPTTSERIGGAIYSAPQK